MNFPRAEIDCDKAMKLWLAERSEYAKEQLVLSNIGLVGMVMKKYDLSIQNEDLFMLGIAGLVKAVNGFDASRECVFSTYAVLCIKHEILHTFRKKEWKLYFL